MEEKISLMLSKNSRYKWVLPLAILVFVISSDGFMSGIICALCALVIYKCIKKLYNAYQTTVPDERIFRNAYQTTVPDERIFRNVIVFIIAGGFALYAGVTVMFRESVYSFVNDREFASISDTRCIVDAVSSSFGFSEKIDFLTSGEIKPDSPQFAKFVTASISCSHWFN